jgi:hypothetical protein
MGISGAEECTASIVSYARFASVLLVACLAYSSLFLRMEAARISETSELQSATSHKIVFFLLKMSLCTNITNAVVP